MILYIYIRRNFMAMQKVYRNLNYFWGKNITSPILIFREEVWQYLKDFKQKFGKRKMENIYTTPEVLSELFGEFLDNPKMEEYFLDWMERNSKRFLTKQIKLEIKNKEFVIKPY